MNSHFRFSLFACRFLLLLPTLFLVHCPQAIAQIHPVYVNTQLAPPYSVYLADYAAPGCEQLRVILVQRDLSQSSYRLFLRMSISLNGREIIRTHPAYRPFPLNISPGVPTVISGSDLYHYLDPNNMEFTGYSRASYLQTKSLPEGAYQISFTACDYARPEISLSLPGSTFCYLYKAEPPLLNMPPNQYIQPAFQVQNVLFSWLPRNLASPNSAASTQYLLELFEIKPAGYNPTEITRNTRPILAHTTTQSNYMYGIADPALTPAMSYAWRVRAIDTQGRDAFRNDGYSEVFTFTYGAAGVAGAPEEPIAAVSVLAVEPVAPRRAKFQWEPQAGLDGYKLMYRKISSGAQSGDADWTEVQTDRLSLELSMLTPGAAYEARLQSKKGAFWGGYSDIVNFQQPQRQEVNCGDNFTLDAANLHRTPLETLLPGHEIDAGGFLITVTEARGSNGRFTGKGYAQMAMLGYVKLAVTFSDIFVNSDYYLVEGVIPVVTDWSKNSAVLNLDETTEGGKNTGKANGNEQVDITVNYEIPDADSFHKDEAGNIVVTDADGKEHIL
ncbi:MAG: fibronectin type III domain-containing protein, partial [Prevotellaceae bacterium]|nr:fibronectin type III domain-containing protein [Prevotellaceae bacterium]